MATNEQELENKEVPVASAENTETASQEKKEGAEETHEAHDHQHSATYAASRVHSAVKHVHPHSHNLDL